MTAAPLYNFCTTAIVGATFTDSNHMSVITYTILKKAPTCEHCGRSGVLVSRLASMFHYPDHYLSSYTPQLVIAIDPQLEEAEVAPMSGMRVKELRPARYTQKGIEMFHASALRRVETASFM